MIGLGLGIETGLCLGFKIWGLGFGVWVGVRVGVEVEVGGWGEDRGFKTSVLGCGVVSVGSRLREEG